MSVSTWLPRPFRFIFCERLIRPWRFMPGPARTFPVAVILKRFLTEDFVFSLGILISSDGSPRERRRRGRACPTGPARKRAAAYSDGGTVAQAQQAPPAA